jgi:hypothetical protein
VICKGVFKKCIPLSSSKSISFNVQRSSFIFPEVQTPWKCLCISLVSPLSYFEESVLMEKYQSFNVLLWLILQHELHRSVEINLMFLFKGFGKYKIMTLWMLWFLLWNCNIINTQQKIFASHNIQKEFLKYCMLRMQKKCWKIRKTQEKSIHQAWEDKGSLLREDGHWAES